MACKWHVNGMAEVYEAMDAQGTHQKLNVVEEQTFHRKETFFDCPVRLSCIYKLLEKF